MAIVKVLVLDTELSLSSTSDAYNHLIIPGCRLTTFFLWLTLYQIGMLNDQMVITSLSCCVSHRVVEQYSLMAVMSVPKEQGEII